MAKMLWTRIERPSCSSEAQEPRCPPTTSPTHKPCARAGLVYRCGVLGRTGGPARPSPAPLRFLPAHLFLQALGVDPRHVAVKVRTRAQQRLHVPDEPFAVRARLQRALLEEPRRHPGTHVGTGYEKSERMRRTWKCFCARCEACMFGGRQLELRIAGGLCRQRPTDPAPLPLPLLLPAPPQ
jgi:hypothetical protein